MWENIFHTYIISNIPGTQGIFKPKPVIQRSEGIVKNKPNDQGITGLGLNIMWVPGILLVNTPQVLYIHIIIFAHGIFPYMLSKIPQIILKFPYQPRAYVHIHSEFTGLIWNLQCIFGNMPQAHSVRSPDMEFTVHIWKYALGIFSNQGIRHKKSP